MRRCVFLFEGRNPCRKWRRSCHSHRSLCRELHLRGKCQCHPLFRRTVQRVCGLLQTHLATHFPTESRVSMLLRQNRTVLFLIFRCNKPHPIFGVLRCPPFLRWPAKVQNLLRRRAWLFLTARWKSQERSVGFLPCAPPRQNGHGLHSLTKLLVGGVVLRFLTQFLGCRIHCHEKLFSQRQGPSLLVGSGLAGRS